MTRATPSQFEAELIERIDEAENLTGGPQPDPPGTRGQRHPGNARGPSGREEPHQISLSQCNQLAIDSNGPMSSGQDVIPTTEALPDNGQDQNAPSKGKGGRPTSYSPELATRICDLVAQRVPVVKICDMDGMPDKATLYRWKRQHTEFCDNYARAREHRADARQDRIDEIVQQMVDGKIDPQTARVAIDAEKWQMGKEQPKRYSDKLQICGDADGDPIKVLAKIERVIVRPAGHKGGEA